MSPTDNTVIMALDAKIAELERDAEKLQNMIQQLATVSANLDSLRKARAVMAAEAGGSSDIAHTNGNGLPRQTPLLPAQGELKAKSELRPPLRGSIGFLAIEVLRQAAKPLHVNDFLPLVQAQGKPGLTEGTFVSTLCGYVKAGRLKRPSPSVYSLP
jgi:hypothetical protein